MPWFDAISLIVALYLLYFTIGALVKFKKPFAFRITNSFLLLLSIYFILYTTLLSRSPNEYPTVLMPFYSFFVAKSQPEMWRQMYMNVVLFMPFGMFLGNVFGEKVKKSMGVGDRFPSVDRSVLDGRGLLFCRSRRRSIKISISIKSHSKIKRRSP